MNQVHKAEEAKKRLEELEEKQRQLATEEEKRKKAIEAAQEKAKELAKPVKNPFPYTIETTTFE